MPYSNFTEERALSKFGLLNNSCNLFPNIIDLEPLEPTKFSLQNVISTMLFSEKVKSELIISPILFDIYYRNRDNIGFFSGYNLNVDQSLELNGECDFILSKNKTTVGNLGDSVFGLVEAKLEDMNRYFFGQCIAQMYGAMVLNQRNGNGIKSVYGCVCTGEVWQFMKLENGTVWVDQKRYYIDRPERILGILQQIIDEYKD